MTIRINNIQIPLEDEISSLKLSAARKLKIGEKGIKDFRIVKESVDARHKNSICFIYSVELNLDGDEKRTVERLNDSDIIIVEDEPSKPFVHGTRELDSRPVVVGSGPAGLYAGLLLAMNGYKPLILERGKSVDERTETVHRFWDTGELDTECNVQFGEGGAGTFSDGKLTTRIKDKRCSMVLDEFVNAGAPSDIVYNYKPHIGTDILKTVVKNIRKKIIENGGEVLFSSKLTDVIIDSGIITGLEINNEVKMDCSILILAIGHSARDTIEMLHRRGISLVQKPFAVGFRIEHKQSMIDEAQYGRFAEHPKLRSADYRFAYNSKKYDRSCYTFCMCPGGLVVAASSEENRVVTNGMSEFARDKENANSALVCGVTEKDFESESPLSGMEFQRSLEETAFRLGGGKYMAPVQRVDDFIKSRKSVKIGTVEPSYTRGYSLTDLNGCLPASLCTVMKEGLADFERKIKGFGSGDAILTGVETRTSSPVRIERGEDCMSVNVSGIYPAGEGAGYAGGIVSAAVDGIKAAEEIMKKYAPIK